MAGLLRFLRRIASAAAIALGAAAWPVSALAYRPFDGTDAAVADPGEIEIEFQPAGVLHEPGQTSLVAPATVLNFGFAKNWEAVLEGRLETPLSPMGPSDFSDAGLFLKHVLGTEACRSRAVRASPPNSACFCRASTPMPASARA